MLFTWNLEAQIFTAITEGEIYNDSLALGSAWGDFDNDGYPDLFASRNQLYFNNGDGTFTKITNGDVVENGSGIGGTVGDYDNDGYLDIYTASIQNLGGKLFHNNGNGTFDQVLEEPFLSDTSDFQASSWVDIENDGDLDLFVTAGGNVGFKDNYLYINNSDGTFSRDTTNLITQDSSSSVNCSWSDFNNDGYVDLFIANGAPGVDSLVNLLYVNNGDGSFTQLMDEAISKDHFFSLGSSWGDYNNDGFMDLFVTNNENKNKLYKNNGDNTFTHINDEELADEELLSTGSSWGDFDNDGDLDLLVTNFSSSNSLYENKGNDIFTKVTGETLSEHGAIGCSSADWDKDGDLDVLFTRTNNGNHAPYLNNGNSNNWINIHCTGVLSNTSAIGTKVWVKATINGNPVWQVREISGQTGVLGQNSLNAHFGLGPDGIIDSIKIHWPSGIVQSVSDVTVNSHIEIIEDINTGVQGFIIDSIIDEFVVYPSPVDDIATVQFELKKPANIDLSIVDLSGSTILNLKNERYFEGLNTVSLQSKSLPNGIYNCRLIVDKNFILNRRVVIQK